MSTKITFDRFLRCIVNIDAYLFHKYEAGIRAHFTEYLQKNHADALDSTGEIDLEALGIGIRAFRENYLKKNAEDYSAQDSAEFLLSGHGLYTAEYMSLNPVRKMIEGCYHHPDSIGHVYVKRSVTTGRLIPCVDRKFAQSFLAEESVNASAEKQLEEMQALLENYRIKQAANDGFEQYQVASLIAEKTAEILMRRMNYSQAV